ncbi:stAR-related lipid transfer protein 5 isoform X4 [Tupaia chinensis]|uniref:stAR-related lipid transfer protein 5 isoform X4 n=1 Tax=Tupaia chinensis TaxID=246437 RepID=UPI0007042512|nr:stAR-related lipid transfer protein 5 isoform X4 [Tupaia chinensis]
MDPTLAAQMSEEVAEKMLQYRRDSSSWKICREGNGVSVSWRPSVEFPGNLYRGEGVVLGTPEEVWECVKPVAGGLRVKWDENVNGFEVIQSITDARGVGWMGAALSPQTQRAPLALADAVREQDLHPVCRHEAHFSQGLCGLGADQEVRGRDHQLQRDPRGTPAVSPEAGFRERIQPSLRLLLRACARGP